MSDDEIRALCKLMGVKIEEDAHDTPEVNLHHSPDGILDPGTCGGLTNGKTLRIAWLRYLWKLGDPDGKE